MRLNGWNMSGGAKPLAGLRIENLGFKGLAAY
jgi:hypothetical protein